MVEIKQYREPTEYVFINFHSSSQANPTTGHQKRRPSFSVLRPSASWYIDDHTRTYTLSVSPLLATYFSFILSVFVFSCRRHGRPRRQRGGPERVRRGEQQHVPGVQPQVSESAHLLAAAEAQRRPQARGTYRPKSHTHCTLRDFSRFQAN